MSTVGATGDRTRAGIRLLDRCKNALHFFWNQFPYRVSNTGMKIDPRHYQILILGALLIYGLGWLELEISAIHAAAILVTVLLTQFTAVRVLKLPGFDPRSPLISGLSLCLLLRTDTVLLAIAAAFITIAGKFVLRWNGKHLFNPTNFGLVAIILMTGRAWVSPGQWGSGAFFGFLLVCLGVLVVNRAERSDVTWAFLGFSIAMLLGRALWLGDPMAIPLHQMQSGALVLFGFFMISDPKTTPDSRTGRILFAFLVALGGFLIQYGLYRPNGIIYSLAFFHLLVPAIDRLLPGPRYRWKQAEIRNEIAYQGGKHETRLKGFHPASAGGGFGPHGIRILRLLRRQG